jgi:hypothetical protein
MKKNSNILMITVITLIIASFILLSLSPTSALAATHYVSSSGGDDTTEGSVDSPWRTISQVNANTGNGDTVLFKRGDVWDLTKDEPLDVPGDEMTISSYGVDSANPLFTGSIQLININSSYEWYESSSGINEYYVTGPAGSDPAIDDPGNLGVVEGNYPGETPFLLWRGSSWKDNEQETPDPHTPGDLSENHDWAYGDIDSLGFNTIYIRDDAGQPGEAGRLESVKVSQVLQKDGAPMKCAIRIDSKEYVVIDGIDVMNIGGIAIRVLGWSRDNEIRNLTSSYYNDGVDVWSSVVGWVGKK